MRQSLLHFSREKESRLATDIRGEDEDEDRLQQQRHATRHTTRHRQWVAELS